MKRLGLSLALLACSQAATAQTPLESLLATPKADTPVYTYDLHIQDEGMTITASVNPVAPMGSRLTINTPAQDTWSKDFAKYAKGLRENTKGNIWCSQFAQMVPPDAKLTAETDTIAQYTFTPIPRPEDEDRMAKVLKHLTGTLTINKTKNAVQSFGMIAEKPFKPMIAAKVTYLQMQTNCTPSPDGRMRIESVKTVVEGKAMMQSFSETETQTISNLQPITAP